MKHFKVKISTSFLVEANNDEEAKAKVKERFDGEAIENSFSVKEISESELVGMIIKTKFEVIR